MLSALSSFMVCEIMQKQNSENISFFFKKPWNYQKVVLSSTTATRQNIGNIYLWNVKVNHGSAQNPELNPVETWTEDQEIHQRNNSMPMLTKKDSVSFNPKLLWNTETTKCVQQFG